MGRVAISHSPIKEENYGGFSDGSRAKGSKRAGAQDFGITENMAFIGALGVIGPGEWVRSMREGQVHSTARTWQANGCNMQTPLYCSQV